MMPQAFIKNRSQRQYLDPGWQLPTLIGAGTTFRSRYEPHAKFIFATTEIRKVPVTVLSRCQRFDLRRVDAALLVRHLEGIAAKEKIVNAKPAALALIARARRKARAPRGRSPCSIRRSRMPPAWCAPKASGRCWVSPTACALSTCSNR